MLRPASVIIVTSVMFTFITFWRTAAVVLCDLASTAYYIGGIVEQTVGPAAPWFILAVMIFSYAVRSVYIESCSLFVRGGVYKVVREALGPTMAKLSVSALMFDYILTGPISGVTAGQYILGLVQDLYLYLANMPTESREAMDFVASFKPWKSWGSVLIACAVTLYFFRQNLIGIHESSEKALKIMIVTTIMAAVLMSWCVLTLLVQGAKNSVPLTPQIEPRLNSSTNEIEDPMGFLAGTSLAKQLDAHFRYTDATADTLRKAGVPESVLAKLEPLKSEGLQTREEFLAHVNDLLAGLDEKDLKDAKIKLQENASKRHLEGWEWFSFVGIIGIMIAFGHSILAMSGEETLAQVYREVESPKLLNFKKAALVVFIYSVVLTGGISFLAVMLIPSDQRMSQYSDNLIGGLAMSVIGPLWSRFLLNAFVVIVGGLILSGAVNTAIIGSNGVLNRVAEDGVMPDWFLKPHPRYGTTHRILYLILGLQLGVILLSQGNVILLGEAYAFGVVWSFVFKALSMVVLRFKDPRPREARVPLNFKIGNVDVPLGLLLILLILLLSAIFNLLTKEIATIGGVIFTVIFFVIFTVSERIHEQKRRGMSHEHLEQFNKETTSEVSPEALGINHRAYRKLIAIRSVHNLIMLERALAETDPETTAMVVMTAKLLPKDEAIGDNPELDTYDQHLMTAVVTLAERAGKEVKPLIVPTNNPLHAVLSTARDLQAHELVMGASNKYTADEQLGQIALYWISMHGGNPPPLTVRIMSRDLDIYQDLGGGNRIPKISERRARSVAELRAAGVGVDRVLLLHDGSTGNSDLFSAVLTMLDPLVALFLLPVVPPGRETHNGHGVLHQDEERAKQLGRQLQVLKLEKIDGPEIVQKARQDQIDLIIIPIPPEGPTNPLGQLDRRSLYIVAHAHCRVMLATTPVIPDEVVDQGPSSG
jgi:amino acid transporter/nucleotide-binding universal stress UspA family protein